MARPRKPTEILEISGGFDRHPERRRPVAPKSAHGIGDPPPDLADDEAGCWHEFVANMPANVLTSADRWIVEKLCRLMAKGRREWLPAAEMGHLRGFLVELGATPASRSKISAAPGTEAPPASPWDVPAVLPGPAARQ